ncbi:SICAvar, type I [Plasmodium knowlesi strain H]|uniref:SICAvar, type I n=1 Tax=Plasmodium knowlesi (strain H) TaxID=5851 RepID=A0A1A7VUB1_PLAKH|nr:SICAvar, type I [Plasmodium knowlesi strain H]
MCERLECMKHLWQNSASGQGNNDNFWTEKSNGAVAQLWKELSDAMTQNGTAEKEECKKLQDGTEASPSEKAACKYLHAGFKALYKDTTTTSSSSSSSPTGDDVLKNNPSFRQTMGCFLLHAYAKHMKEKATCLIDEGIQKAFTSAGNGNNGTDIPCQWKETDYENCNININGTSVPDETAKKKVDAVLEADKTNIDKMAKQINKVDSLCDQVQCVTKRWMSQNGAAPKKSWGDVWTEVGKELTQLAKGTTKDKREDTEITKYCDKIPPGKDGKTPDKDACLLIAAGLKNLYDIKDNENGNDAVKASLKRTMQCVLLNAIADKMKEKLPCKEERSVEDGINKAFDNSEAIKKEGEGCKTNDKCFICPRFEKYSECRIKESAGGEEKTLKEKIDPKLEDTGLYSTNSLMTSSLTKTICKPCTGDSTKTLCQQVECIRGKYGQIRKEGDNATWSKMEGDFNTQLTNLLNYMKGTDNQAKVAIHCDKDTTGKKWKNDDAHDVANKIACQLVARGLQYISTIQESYSGGQPNPYDNQEFKQFFSCLMLKAVVEEMKKKSHICDIEPGIKAATQAWNQIKGTHCTKEPCIDCNLDVFDKYDDCPIGNNANVKVKSKLNDLLTQKNDDVNTALTDITITYGNAASSLCLRLQCLASRVQALATSNGQYSSNASSFWDSGGEVANLWNELSAAMKKSNGQGTNDCNQMDDDNRTATNPEKKACNYLHAGLKQLYQPDNSATGTTNNSILSNPSLRRTMGCLLLHSYAKHMKDKANCLVESGIKKAFDTVVKNLRGSCNDGEGPCVLCHWNEKDYEGCKITTTGNTQTEAKTKVEGIVKTESVSNAMKEINHMGNLCDYIKCAAPKWFHNQKNNNKQAGSGSSGTATKSWCDFWGDKGVKLELQKMFQKIATEGQNNRTSITIRTACRGFGDGNADSVETKVCNHITAGLIYINTITGETTTQSSVAQIPNAKDDDKFFKQSMMCAALNLYADKIKNETEKSCPIDEKRIKEMFDNWNVFNKPSSSSSCSKEVYGCFECKRNENFNDCHLSVADALVDEKNRSGTCSSNTNRDKVHDEMNELLKENNTPKVKSTLTTITDMDTFCSRMQCAAKQYVNKTKGKSTDIKWDTLSTINDMSKSFCTQLQCAAKQFVKKNPNNNSTNVSWETLSTINDMSKSFCTQLQCAAKQYYVKVKNKSDPNANSSKVSWNDINSVVKDELTQLLEHITDDKNWKEVDSYCKDVSSSSNNDTEGEITAKKKACKLFALGLKHISKLKDDQNNDAIPLKQTMMCAALNLYADQLIKKANNQCPLDGTKLDQAIKHAFQQYNATMNGKTSCGAGSNGTNSCFVCNREDKFHNCQIGNNPNDKVKNKMNTLLLNNEDQSNSNTPNKEKTLDKINKIETFCTQLQCAIKQYGMRNKKITGQNGTVTWDDINNEAKGVLEQLLKQITEPSQEKDVVDFCKDNAAWNKGHKERKTNKAACLLFSSGLKHIYVRGRKSVKGPFKGPSFEQTIGCLFLKEYAEQLQKVANEKKKGHSWVHPLCDIDKGIKHAFEQSKDIMKFVLPECSNGTDGISCFECTFTDTYDKCPIGDDEVKTKIEPMFTDPTKQTEMEETLSNTVCPILLTDLLTPFLPLAPVSIGLSAMAYYLWKYFGPLGKGGARFRRSPTEIPGPSVQEQVLDHVEEAGPHEYQLVKERKPRSVPTRTKRSGRVNRRTIIEIHFEVLDECQKGDTQLNQKDFLELLVQEFMGSEFMKEEQVPKEDVLMEPVPMELVPIEEVPNLGSGFMV